MANQLATKNRTANEFRMEAHKLRAELADASKQFTGEEVTKRLDAIKVLEQRAQAAAEFTADAEIERQGGDADLVRIDAGEREERAKGYESMQDAHEQVRKVAVEAFGNVGNFLRATQMEIGRLSDKERKALRKMEDMTRTITGSTSGGEFLLPLTQVPEIFSIANAQPGLFQFARRYNVPGRSLRIPYLVQDEGTTTLNRPLAGKIANIAIVGEGSTKPERDPVFAQRVLTMYKYAAVTQFGDEILADDFTGELPAEVTNAVGGQVLNKINEDITIDGTGSSQPLGAVNSNNAAIITVNRATASDFTVADAFAMYERHTLGPNSVWLVSRRVQAKLMAMTLTNNGLVTWLTNLRDTPQLVLLGIPVVVSDLMAPLGTYGDVALVNGDFYAMGLRQALTVQSSIHYKFAEDITTYRFVARAGGIPIPTGTFAYKVDGSGNKVDPHSPFTVLDVPASS